MLSFRVETDEPSYQTGVPPATAALPWVRANGPPTCQDRLSPGYMCHRTHVCDTLLAAIAEWRRKDRTLKRPAAAVGCWHAVCLKHGGHQRAPADQGPGCSERRI